MVGIAGMLTTGAVVLGASSASAHTPSISATCEMLTVDLTGFQPTIPAKPAVTHEEYLFEHAPNGVYKTAWHSDKNWNAQGNAQSTGWRLKEPLETRIVTDVPATPAKTNHITVTINGATVVDVDFGTTYSSTFPFADKYQSNSWAVSWTAYDGAKWSGEANGATTACPLPSTPDKDAVATASTTPGTCLAKGAVTFDITNATWDDASDTTDGSRTATATAGHAFANGATTATVNYTIPPQTDWKDAACQPTFEVTQVCGNITITFHNNSKWDRWPDYRIEGDGVQPKDYGTGPTYTTVKVPAGQSVKILDHDFAEDYNGGSADVTYQDILGAERDIDTAAVTVTVDTDCQPPVTNTICEIPAAGDTSTNLHPLWTDVDTRSAGHSEYVSGGLRLWTDDASSNAKVAQERAADFDLKNTGLVGLDFDLTSGTIKPGVQLYVNFDGTNEGTLVFEEAYGQDLWLTTGSSQVVKDGAPVIGGGNGSQWHGTIDQWLTKFPTAKVTGIGFSLGSGVHADGVLHSITVGCTQYFFDRETAPQTPPVVVPPVTPGVPPVVVPPVTPTPPEVGGVKVTAPPEVEGVKHTSPAVTPTVEGVKHGAAAALPRTGTDAGQYGAAGLLLLMAGLGLVLVTRRHGRGRAH